MILIAAKGGCQSRRVTPTTAEKGELLLADVPPGIRLMAAYFPQGKAKAPFFEICIKEAISSQGAPLLFLGDVNTGHNKVDIEGRSVPFTGAEIFAALTTEAGLIDLWRAEHGDKRGWSWRSPINGFRVDHAFANASFLKSFAVTRCFYDHSTRETGLTDHSALLVEFDAA